MIKVSFKKGNSEDSKPFLRRMLWHLIVGCSMHCTCDLGTHQIHFFNIEIHSHSSPGTPCRLYFVDSGRLVGSGESHM